MIINVPEQILGERIKDLEAVYSQIPPTLNCTGCGLCCMVQHPHCYYIEFLNMYLHIMNEWSEEKKLDLHIACIENYLKNTTKKRCIFLQEDNACGIYEQRDYNCRMFGSIPKDVYKRRVKDKKKQFTGTSLSLKKQTDCCSEVSSSRPLEEGEMDEWFERIYNLDAAIGVHPTDMAEANNYMTFHDHYILHNFMSQPDVLSQLTYVKENYSNKQKREFLESMRENTEKKDE